MTNKHFALSGVPAKRIMYECGMLAWSEAKELAKFKKGFLDHKDRFIALSLGTGEDLLRRSWVRVFHSVGRMNRLGVKVDSQSEQAWPIDCTADDILHRTTSFLISLISEKRFPLRVNTQTGTSDTDVVSPDLRTHCNQHRTHFVSAPFPTRLRFHPPYATHLPPPTSPPIRPLLMQLNIRTSSYGRLWLSCLAVLLLGIGRQAMSLLRFQSCCVPPVFAVELWSFL